MNRHATHDRREREAIRVASGKIRQYYTKLFQSSFEAFAPNGRHGRGQKYGTDETPTTGLDHKGDSGDVRKARITIDRLRCAGASGRYKYGELDTIVMMTRVTGPRSGCRAYSLACEYERAGPMVRRPVRGIDREYS